MIVEFLERGKMKKKETKANTLIIVGMCFFRAYEHFFEHHALNEEWLVKRLVVPVKNKRIGRKGLMSESDHFMFPTDELAREFKRQVGIVIEKVLKEARSG